ncbi:MAG TPA: 4Fe-4S binding protein, partial [Tepidisphaeraceae bacterium]|nr:4Fe-4S binding protein [Tepidisphaeraceae bacterium]
MIQVLSLGIFLYLFIYVAWPYAEDFSGQVIARKEWLPLETFLWLDPLVGLSTAIASRQWNVAVGGMLGILVLCLFWPRGFCGYLCPLGTLIDGF